MFYSTYFCRCLKFSIITSSKINEEEKGKSNDQKLSLFMIIKNNFALIGYTEAKPYLILDYR